jgi:hypothetical protein
MQLKHRYSLLAINKDQLRRSARRFRMGGNKNETGRTQMEMKEDILQERENSN